MSNLHAEAFTKNKQIPIISKIIALVLPFAVAIGFFAAGKEMMGKLNCAMEIRTLAYGLMLCVAAQSVYFWCVNYKKCRNALRSLVDNGRLQFRENGKKIRIVLDGREISNSSKHGTTYLWFGTFLFIGLFFTGNLFMSRACSGQTIGHPGASPILAFYSFITIALNHFTLLRSSFPRIS